MFLHWFGHNAHYTKKVFLPNSVNLHGANTGPRNVFLKAFVFGVLNKTALGFLTLTHILELLFLGDLFNYLVLGDVSDPLATGNII